MRRLITLLCLTALLSFAACGGDDEEEPTTTAGATGATGAEDAVEGAGAGEISTAGDLIDASIPDQAQAVEDKAAEIDGCEGVDTKPGGDFQVGVAIAAASADPETPLSEIVAAECEEE